MFPVAVVWSSSGGVTCGTLCTSGFVDDVIFSYSIFPYLHFPTLHTRTLIFRTCVFHPCVAVLEFSVLVFSTRTHFATLYFTFPYLHFPVLAILAPPPTLEVIPLEFRQESRVPRLLQYDADCVIVNSSFDKT